MSAPPITLKPVILVFDSGIGGLTVYAEIIKRLPHARYVYVADDAAFPYGIHATEVLIERVNLVIGAAIARYNPDLVVIACNTASTVCMPSLRKAFPMPFVGTVPAVKPAAALSSSKMISILGTAGTVSREYTHDLIITHAADCRVTLVGASRLASLAEDFLKGIAVSNADVLAEILPCFKEKEGRRTDTIALACTHYPLLQDVYDRVAPWSVQWVDPAPSIAARVVTLLTTEAKILPKPIDTSRSVAVFTSGLECAAKLAFALELRGLQSTMGFYQPFNQYKG